TRSILDTERGIPLQARIALQARVALQRGLVLTHLGDFTAAREELRVAEGLGERHLVLPDRLECRGALAYLAYCLGEIEEARDLVVRARGLLASPGADPDLARSGFLAPA
ncbi:LuxR family transcriptional regulator, partial [Clavibacter michiganensis subsp. insidiosus]